MIVSVFTDASVLFKNCGYAFYIGCKMGKLQKAGRLKARTSKVDLAELHCIANAIYTLKHSKFTPIDKVFVYCDNAQCVGVLNGDMRFSDPDKRKVIDEIHFLMIEVCIKNGKTMRDIDTFFSVNHIKAHTGNADIFSKINDWCDKNAKLYSNNKSLKKLKKSA